MQVFRFTGFWLIVIGAILGVSAQQGDSPPTYADVAPIFQERCIICHNGPGAPKQLQLTDYEKVLKGSENGPVVVPGDPANSELIKRLKGISQPRMPLTGPPYLTDEQIALFERWIAAGAKEAPPAPAAEPPQPPPPPKPGKPYLTYSDVKPIFHMRCVKCHNTRGLMGPPPEELILASYADILDTRERARVIPGNPDASELVRRIRGQARPRMPFDGPPYLTEEEIRRIETWITQGARDDNGNVAPLPVGARVRLHGTLTARWELDGLPLRVTGRTRLKKGPRVGDYVQVRGRLLPDGSIEVSRLRRR
ncbi:MAG: hypothetical protein D6681_10085 [Calditrichaeota bacterium]|nr:MAG: hypothetical protein D6681_10085 [Calditrichota bacterium]